MCVRARRFLVYVSESERERQAAGAGKPYCVTAPTICLLSL
jgi:hypothetical protein